MLLQERLAKNFFKIMTAIMDGTYEKDKSW